MTGASLPHETTPINPDFEKIKEVFPERGRYQPLIHTGWIDVEELRGGQYYHGVAENGEIVDLGLRGYDLVPYPLIREVQNADLPDAACRAAVIHGYGHTAVTFMGSGARTGTRQGKQTFFAPGEGLSIEEVLAQAEATFPNSFGAMTFQQQVTRFSERDAIPDPDIPFKKEREIEPEMTDERWLRRYPDRHEQAEKARLTYREVSETLKRYRRGNPDLSIEDFFQWSPEGIAADVKSEVPPRVYENIVAALSDEDALTRDAPEGSLTGQIWEQFDTEHGMGKNRREDPRWSSGKDREAGIDPDKDILRGAPGREEIQQTQSAPDSVVESKGPDFPISIAPAEIMQGDSQETTPESSRWRKMRGFLGVVTHPGGAIGAKLAARETTPQDGQRSHWRRIATLGAVATAAMVGAYLGMKYGHHSGSGGNALTQVHPPHGGSGMEQLPTPSGSANVDDGLRLPHPHFTAPAHPPIEVPKTSYTTVELGEWKPGPGGQGTVWGAASNALRSQGVHNPSGPQVLEASRIIAKTSDIRWDNDTLTHLSSTQTLKIPVDLAELIDKKS